MSQKKRWSALRARSTLLAAGLLVLGTAATVLPGLASTAASAATAATAATPSCGVTYSVTNSWSGGFQASIAITNNAAAISNWTLAFTFPNDQKVTSGWNGTFTQGGANVTVTNASYNGALATGASTTIGFTGTVGATNANPTAFTLNGAACNGATPPPTTTPPTTTPPTTTTTPPPSTTAPQLHVSGNKLVDANGNQVVLHGVDRSGGEFACVQGSGIWDGPMDATSVQAIKTWHVTAVRVPLNEACWNAESYVNSAYSGTTYQNAVKAYVSLLNSNGIVAILDLHWTDGTYTGSGAGCSSAQATCQKPMPDAAQAVPFWTSVASAFKGNNAVIFDLFNEPYPDQANNNATQAWSCWLNGGSACVGISYPVAGMQSLVNAVRGAGAGNVIMLGGLTWSNDLTQWLAHKPADPDNNLAASWHSYNFNACSSQSCWTSQIAPVIASVPLIAGEFGENDCADGYVNGLMSWLDSEHASYLAWTWNTWNCSSGPALITDYTGTPTTFGAGVRTHLQSVG